MTQGKAEVLALTVMWCAAWAAFAWVVVTLLQTGHSGWWSLLLLIPAMGKANFTTPDEARGTPEAP